MPQTGDTADVLSENRRATPPTPQGSLTLFLRGPVIVVVLAATAIPFELHWPPHLWSVAVPALSEILANIAGYLPVGMVLAPLGRWRAMGAALLLSMVAESAQTVMVHRDPSLFDAVANLAGGIAGVLVASAVSTGAVTIRVNCRRALIALAAAVALSLGAWGRSAFPMNKRGVTEPGTLEAHWTFDDAGARIVRDSTNHHLDGTRRNPPSTVAGILGNAASFNGADDAIDFGQATAFRLAGSMTVSAWIRPSSFPVDDAAIVSTFDHVPEFALGWQLDTTVDRGPRTIGFKLADECGQLFARYGASRLQVDTWYHVAGVYDAEHRTMTVYLNGKSDDGFLLGSVSGMHRSSRQPAVVGRRSDRQGFEFSGAIDDVRVYSFPLTPTEVADVMQGKDVEEPSHPPSPRDVSEHRGCEWLSEPADARLPGAIAMIGVLVAIACGGLLRRPDARALMVGSLLAGIALVPLTAPTLPAAKAWIIPLTAAAGGASVITSLVGGRDVPGRHGRSEQ